MRQLGVTDSERKVLPVLGGSLASAPMTADLVEAFSAVRGEPAWLRNVRLRGWGAFSPQPMPTTRDEGWRRTDLRALDLDALLNPPAYLPAPNQPVACVKRVLAKSNAVAGTLVVQDSAEVSTELDA